MEYDWCLFLGLVSTLATGRCPRIAINAREGYLARWNARDMADLLASNAFLRSSTWMDLNGDWDRFMRKSMERFEEEHAGTLESAASCKLRDGSLGTELDAAIDAVACLCAGAWDDGKLQPALGPASLVGLRPWIATQEDEAYFKEAIEHGNMADPRIMEAVRTECERIGVPSMAGAVRAGVPLEDIVC